MKKFIIASFVAISALMATSANAQTLASSQAIRSANNAECCTEQAVCSENDPFAGLNLTDAQKAKIKGLNAECHKQRKEAKDAKKAAAKAAREEKARNANESRRSYLAKVKEILTPEQYVTYLENAYVNIGRPNGRRPERFHKEGRMAKDGQKGRINKGSKKESK